MTDTKILENLIKRSGLSKEDVSSALDINIETLQAKIDGKEEFFVSEITKLQDMLNMSKTERNEVFFSDSTTNGNDMNDSIDVSLEIIDAMDMTAGLIKLFDLLHSEYAISSSRSLSDEEKYHELASMLPTLKASAQGIFEKIDIVYDYFNDRIAFNERQNIASIMKG